MKAQELVKGFDVFQNQYANPEEEKDEFSIASQHYDFFATDHYGLFGTLS